MSEGPLTFLVCLLGVLPPALCSRLQTYLQASAVVADMAELINPAPIVHQRKETRRRPEVTTQGGLRSSFVSD